MKFGKRTKMYAILSILMCGFSFAADYYDGLIVESDYYQLDPKNQARDQQVMEQKENLARSTASVLANIAQIDEAIYEIDEALATYKDEKARNILLTERRKLFNKRKEYLALSAAYTQEQSRMTASLTYNSDQYRGARGDASTAGNQGFTLDGTPSGGVGVDTPNWKRQENSQAKPFIRVENEKNMKELAETISKQIYGEFNQEIYVELLQQNFNNTISPTNLMAGDIVFLPQKVAMLTMMGIQEKQLIDVTMAIIAEVKDADLKRNLIRYAADADSSPEVRKAFTEVLISLKLNGENSSEFKESLTKYHRAYEKAGSGNSSQMLVSNNNQIEIKGEFREKVVLVSNASLQLDMLPADTQEKVRVAAKEYKTLQSYAKEYGAAHQKTKTQMQVFEKAINTAYTAVKAYQSSGGSVANSRFTVEEDVTGTRSQANAKVGLNREVRDINRLVLQLIQDTVDIVGSGWTAEGTWWENLTESHKKEATRKLYELTNMETESSRANQLFNRLKLIYANSDRYSVELYSDSEFASLRKNMIALVGMAMAVKDVQPSWWRNSDGKFRDLNSSSALRRLGIDPDKKMYMDRGDGAKPQFEDLMESKTEKLSLAAGLRTRWLSGLASIASLDASFADQDRLRDTANDAHKFFNELSDKMDRGISGTLIGTGIGAGATGLTLLAVSNFWNPVGWVAAGIVGGGAAVGLALGNNVDQNKQIQMIQRYGNVKVIAELGVIATEPGKLRLVEGMLYFDEIVKGY